VIKGKNWKSNFLFLTFEMKHTPFFFTPFTV
jgi:hypothetical protein